MILTSQAPGSKSMYAENREVATIVTTKGTVVILIRLYHIHWTQLTIIPHGLPKWWTDAEHDSREDVLETRDKEKSRILRIFNV